MSLVFVYLLGDIIPNNEHIFFCLELIVCRNEELNYDQ